MARYPRGVSDVSCLNWRLKFAKVPYPTASAMCAMGCSVLAKRAQASPMRMRVMYSDTFVRACFRNMRWSPETLSAATSASCLQAEFLRVVLVNVRQYPIDPLSTLGMRARTEDVTRQRPSAAVVGEMIE